MSSPTPTTTTTVGTTTSEVTTAAATTSSAATTASEAATTVVTTAIAATTTKTEKTTTAVITTSIPIGQVGQLNFAVFKRTAVLPPSPTRSAHPGRSPTKFQYDHLICTKPISSSFVKPSFFTFESTQPTPISSDHLFTLSRFGGFTQPANTSTLGSTTGNPPISPNLRSPKSPVFVAPKSPGFLGQQNSAISSIFGAMPMAAVGVSGTGNWGTGFVKYQPSMGTDVFMKNEQVTSINTKQYCITTMKVYEGKSLEELRMEDYLSNNKGPRAGAVDVLCPNTPPAKNLLGAPAQAQQVNGNFGQQPIPFGNTNVMPGFGQQRAFGAGQASAGGLINKPPAPTMTTSSFGFGNTANTPPTNLFVPPKPFGPPPVTGNVFGAGQTAQPAFGNPIAPPAFGQPNICFDQANVPPGHPFFGSSPIVPVFGHTIAVFGNPVLGQIIPNYYTEAFRPYNNSFNADNNQQNRNSHVDAKLDALANSVNELKMSFEMKMNSLEISELKRNMQHLEDENKILKNVVEKTQMDLGKLNEEIAKQQKKHSPSIEIQGVPKGYKEGINVISIAVLLLREVLDVPIFERDITFTKILPNSEEEEEKGTLLVNFRSQEMKSRVMAAKDSKMQDNGKLCIRFEGNEMQINIIDATEHQEIKSGSSEASASP